MTDIAEAFEQLPGSPGCFVCDANGTNARALGLKIFWDATTKTVHIPCEPERTWCGFETVVHGGIVASVLDEAMAWAAKQECGDWAFTAEYHLRYKCSVEPGQAYTAVGKVVAANRRTISTEAQFLDAQGKVLVQATATFLPVKGRAVVREG